MAENWNLGCCRKKTGGIVSVFGFRNLTIRKKISPLDFYRNLNKLEMAKTRKKSNSKNLSGVPMQVEFMWLD